MGFRLGRAAPCGTCIPGRGEGLVFRESTKGGLANSLRRVSWLKMTRAFPEPRQQHKRSGTFSPHQLLRSFLSCRGF
jgi:hypothetical protein